MGELAFVFPGQGSQRPGMARSLRSTDPTFLDRLLRLAEELSGIPLRRRLDGPAEALTRTEVAQPALFAVELAVHELTRRYGIRPAAVTGHSLGEYAAAVAAGCLSAEDGMQLVVERSTRMAAIQAARPGAMAAVIGPEAETVASWCVHAGDVNVANLNGPAQTVVSGGERAVDDLCAIAREGGARAVRLPVGGAFHTPAMQPVREALARSAAALTWRSPEIPIAGNATGALLTTAAEVRSALVDQVTAPVRWTDCVRALAAAGCDTFLELGPGRVLGGLIRAVDPRAEVHAADSRESLSAVAQHRLAA